VGMTRAERRRVEVGRVKGEMKGDGEVMMGYVPCREPVVRFTLPVQFCYSARSGGVISMLNKS
jgi:hypothetical protein